MSQTQSRSWYLDPLVARQKKATHLELFHRWSRGLKIETLLKTDVFEEAHGDDQLLLDGLTARRLVGIDLDETTVSTAQTRGQSSGVLLLVADARALPFRDGSISLAFSTSTLDHFSEEGQIERSIQELSRALEPGGRLIVTLDNPANPFYQVMRLLSASPRFPFLLGKTLSARRLAQVMQESGLRLIGEEIIIHNPRLLSTLLFLALRRSLGALSNRPIGLLLRLFGSLDSLPTRRWSGCFVAACAEKPVSHP